MSVLASESTSLGCSVIAAGCAECWSASGIMTLRVALVRTSLVLNTLLVLYLCITWIFPTPSLHSLSARDLVYLSYPAAVHSQPKGIDVLDRLKHRKIESEPVLSAPIPLDQPLGTVQRNNGIKDVSLHDRMTPEHLPKQPEAVNGDGNIKSAVTEYGALQIDPPDLPPESLEHKMFPDLKECTTRPLRPFFKQRGDYWVLENYLPATMAFRCDESITFSTHGDYTFLDNLGPVASRWQGPVSVAVYASGDDFEASIKTILYLRDCWSEDIKKYVTFHFFFHSHHMPNKIPSTEELLKRNIQCEQVTPRWFNVTTYRQHKNLMYPVNLARNIARQAVQTYFVVSSDMELYPSINFIPEFFRMLKRPDVSNTTNPRVFVFSKFEVQKNAPVPETKEELLKMLRKREAIHFHTFLCPPCHFGPMFHKWPKYPVNPGLSVFHVGKRTASYQKWEPTYVGTNKEPLDDERLSWEGMSDKMTQMYILCVRDYEFHILDNAFLVHRPGIKRLHSDPVREKFVAKQNFFIAHKIFPEYRIIFGVREGCTL
ncbi:beta-1,4-glucuronyltransferase 1-like isoform X2 [Portunus trituberculatus]|uniref:beta-1,4-glucuronyltransferase 1-like isoform X2 n=1 Tax=Portunus trituberculatus TaxID=210409 RepID=UPI001E1D0839|nr:beta-1,4-glucuronyltransferase 1-like isoform X2 [Portunus trituberculatus]